VAIPGTGDPAEDVADADLLGGPQHDQRVDDGGEWRRAADRLGGLVLWLWDGRTSRGPWHGAVAHACVVLDLLLLWEGKTLPQRERRSTDTAQPAFTCGS